MSAFIDWVCRACGSPNIQERGSYPVTYPGSIVTDEDGVLSFSQDEGSEVCWDCYDFETYECRDCGASAETIAELIRRAVS